MYFFFFFFPFVLFSGFGEGSAAQDLKLVWRSVIFVQRAGRLITKKRQGSKVSRMRTPSGVDAAVYSGVNIFSMGVREHEVLPSVLPIKHYIHA